MRDIPQPSPDAPDDPYRAELERLRADGTACPDCGEHARVLNDGFVGDADVLCICEVCRTRFWVDLRREADPDRGYDKED